MATLTVSAADEKRVKGMGFLSNKGTDNFSARIITVNGRITAQQQRCIAEAAEKYGNGDVVFTTRLTVEVPGIPYEKIGEFQEFISKEGLVTGGTGSRVRPVVACKGTTCQYGLLDSYALSREIHERFYVGYHDVKLPHKFKIAVGGCPNNCVKPDLNDLSTKNQLDNLVSLLNDISSGAVLKSLSIEGVASPDGSYDSNLKLAQKRTDFLQDFIAQRLQVSGYERKSGARVTSWKELADTVMVYDTTLAKRLLEVISVKKAHNLNSVAV